MEVIRELTILGAVIGTIFTIIAIAMKKDSIVDSVLMTLLVVVIGIVASCVVITPWKFNMADDLKINKWLAQHYGMTIDGMAIYRVIWSTGLTEHRNGKYDIFAGSIYVRTEVGVKEVLKYPFDQDRWILEKLINVDNNDELVTKTSYEPLYIFKDKDGNYLPLIGKAVEYYMHVITNGTKTNKTILMDEAVKEGRRRVRVLSSRDWFGDE